MCDRLRSGAKCDGSLEILGLIFIIRDWPSEAVNLIPTRSPARSVPLSDDPMDAVGRKESIVDALPQAVFVNRISKKEVSIAIIFTQRRGRHAELIGRLKVIENDPPRTIVARTSSM